MERVATQLRVSIIKRYFQAVCCRFRLQNLHVVENRRRDENIRRKTETKIRKYNLDSEQHRSIFLNEFWCRWGDRKGVFHLVDSRYGTAVVGMMAIDNISEWKLKAKNTISTSFGEDLLWDYLCCVREYPVKWTAPDSDLVRQQR